MRNNSEIQDRWDPKIRFLHEPMFFHFLILFLGLTIQHPLFSQSPILMPMGVYKNNINYTVNSIYQDRTGYLWLATSQGLVRHDGLDFFEIPVNDILIIKNITSIIEDPFGILWLGQKDGKIFTYSNLGFAQFNPDESIGETEISSLFFDSDSVLWFSTLGEGIYNYSGKVKKRLRIFMEDEGLANNYAYCFAEDDHKNLFIGTDNGISVFNLTTGKFTDRISMEDGMPDNIVRVIKYNNHELIIGLEDGGVCRYNISNKTFTTYGDWQFGAVTGISLIGKNELWISTRKNGVVRLQTPPEQPIKILPLGTKNGLISDQTYCIYSDSENNLWVGSKNGISKRCGNYFEFLQSSEELPLNEVYSLLVDNAGNIWAATSTGVLRVSTDNMGNLTSRIIFSSAGFKNKSFISVYEDNLKNIWIGTYGSGVYKVNPENFTYENFNSKNSILNDNIIDISGNSKKIWFSTLGGGAVELDIDKHTFSKFDIENGLSSNYIYSTFSDSKQNIWMATDGGEICILTHDQGLIPLSFVNKEYSKTVYDVNEGPNGKLWFITANEGLFKVADKKLTQINDKNGLRSNDIRSFTVLKNNQLVLVHNLGIDLYTPADSSFIYFSENFNVSGLSPSLNAIFKDINDNIWIGHKNGIIKYTPQYEINNTSVPKVVISEIQLFFNRIADSISTFRYNQNHITIKYSGFWYQDPKSIIFRYQLKGFDIDWNQANTNRMVTYSNLPPGEYQFEVQVSNGAGKWHSGTDATYSFKIKNPYWKTPIFIILTTLFLVLFVLYLIRRRTLNLKNEKIKLEAEVKKRTFEISQQKEEIEAQRDEIEAQRDEVTNQRDRISLQNQSITSSILYAKQIQEALLPPSEIFDQQLGEYFIFNRPRDIVSGDFYYIHPLTSTKLIVAAADCTGHGVPGAFMSVLGISLLREIVSMSDPEKITAGELLDELNKKIQVSLRQTGKVGEAKDGMDISLCIFDLPNLLLNYAGAYNPIYHIRNQEITVYKATMIPIGIHMANHEIQFKNNLIEIKKNDCIYLFSDGYMDQFGGTHNSKYKSSRFRELLVQHSQLSMTEQYKMIENEMINWMGNESQIDDILVLGIKI